MNYLESMVVVSCGVVIALAIVGGIKSLVTPRCRYPLHQEPRQ